MTRLIDVDVLPRHGNRGGIVQWHDIEKAPTVDAVQFKWTPCSERLPEHPIPSGTKEAHKGYRYLVSLNTGKVHIAIWRFYVGGMNANGLIGVWSWNRQYRNKIIAWSELPTPYHPD